jgi:lysophospholipid acyltransferase (LPLAT)-like uncharacterized protein
MRLDSTLQSARQEHPLNTETASGSGPKSAWRRAAIWPIALLMRLWWRTVHFAVEPADKRAICDTSRPTVFILWHNRLFLSADIIRRYRGGKTLYSLISASGDGSWLAALFWALGLPTVRGSSSRLGREATAELIDVLSQGFDAGVTPDGPRGPAYILKPGALIVARRTKARVCLVGIDFEHSWRVASWDGFYLPRPFSTVHMRFEELTQAELGGDDSAAPAIERRLREMNPDRVPAPVRKRASA